jgi:LPXTG-motif cell wall-anchored protein
MHLDVRIPLGLLFLLLGLILVGFGFTSDPAIYVQHSLGQNVNLVWGAVFALFGAAMLLLTRRKKSD